MSLSTSESSEIAKQRSVECRHLHTGEPAAVIADNLSDCTIFMRPKLMPDSDTNSLPSWIVRARWAAAALSNCGRPENNSHAREQCERVS